jgi:hypothetical protein
VLAIIGTNWFGANDDKGQRQLEARMTMFVSN